MPKNGDKDHSLNLGRVLKRIWAIPRYREGVVAQFFYVGAQIMCWTFIIQYGTRVFTQTGMEEQAAEVLSQRYNIVAMAIFCVSRFICTFLMKYFSPGALLMTFAIAGSALTAGVIGFQNINGMYCLVGVSACMSLMFPTIYGIALEGLGDDARVRGKGAGAALRAYRKAQKLCASTPDIAYMPQVCLRVAQYETQYISRKKALAQLAEAKQGFLVRKKEGDETAQSWLDETEAVIRQLLERE